MTGAGRRRSPRVHTVVLDGEAVLLDEAAVHLHRLNAAGTAVWLALDGEAGAAELAAVLGDGGARAVDAVRDLLAHLDGEGLLG